VVASQSRGLGNPVFLSSPRSFFLLSVGIRGSSNGLQAPWGLTTMAGFRQLPPARERLAKHTGDGSTSIIQASLERRTSIRDFHITV
jgi:hypothetical protein